MVRRSKEGHLARSHLPIKTTRNTSLVFRKRLAFESENRVRRPNGLAVNGTARTPSGRGFKSRYDQFGNPLEKKTLGEVHQSTGLSFADHYGAKSRLRFFPILTNLRDFRQTRLRIFLIFPILEIIRNSRWPERFVNSG